MRFSKSRSSGGVVLGIACTLLGAALGACGQPQSQVPGPSATPALVGTATSVGTAASRPPFSACKIVNTLTGATVKEIDNTHGVFGGFCETTPGSTIIVASEGRAAGDSRPGFSVCAPPGGESLRYCGIASGPPDTALDTSYAANWRFYPFPVPDAHEVGPETPFYVCLGRGSQLWTFHFNTFDYTSGCKVPPDSTGLDACGVFTYSGASDLSAYSHGDPAACAQYGVAIISAVNGNPQPGLELCAAPSGSSTIAIYDYCSLTPAKPPEPGHWHFVPLPVAAGPVTGATFDTAGGTACVTVGAQSFTFTLATMSVTSGCAAGAVPSPTP